MSVTLNGTKRLTDAAMRLAISEIMVERDYDEEDMARKLSTSVAKFHAWHKGGETAQTIFRGRLLRYLGESGAVIPDAPEDVRPVAGPTSKSLTAPKEPTYPFQAPDSGASYAASTVTPARGNPFPTGFAMVFVPKTIRHDPEPALCFSTAGIRINRALRELMGNPTELLIGVREESRSIEVAIAKPTPAFTSNALHVSKSKGTICRSARRHVGKQIANGSYRVTPLGNCWVTQPIPKS